MCGKMERIEGKGSERMSEKEGYENYTKEDFEKFKKQVEEDKKHHLETVQLMIESENLVWAENTGALVSHTIQTSKALVENKNTPQWQRKEAQYVVKAYNEIFEAINKAIPIIRKKSQETYRKYSQKRP
jgi:hypothetical protein